MTTPRSNPVKLHDGTVVQSDSEAWRAECEARSLLRRPSRQSRLYWLAMVEQKRGKDSRDKLYADAMRIWEYRQTHRPN